MVPVKDSFVRLKSESSSKLGIVQGTVPGDEHYVQVRWLPEQRVGRYHVSKLTTGMRVGDEVFHEGSHQGMESLGHGRVLSTRTFAGEVQHLVEFWPRSERRWLPWQRLRPVESVARVFQRLPEKAGEAEALRLRNLAYALSEWNVNTGGLGRLEIDPLPHQLYLVNRILASGDLNWMIADDVGLGKTIEVGLLLAALRQRRFRRFLVIVPAGLTRQWEEELRDKFMMDDFVIYGETVMPETPSQWRLYDRVIVSMDRAKHANHLPNILQAEDWDLIVIDEAHRLSRREWGSAFDTTERYQMAQALRPRASALLLLTGTPHQGRDDLFRGLLELLRPGREWRQRFLTLRTHPSILSTLIIRNRKADVTDQHGNFIFRGKTSSTIEVRRSPEEIEFEAALVKYLREGYNASRLFGQKGLAIGFVMTTFRKLAASSLAAIERSLSRRAEKLRSEVADSESGSSTDRENAEVDARFVEADEVVSGEATEFFTGELEALDDLVSRARALVPTDSKVLSLFREVLPRILSDEPNRKVLIFTEYRTTQDVLVNGLVDRYGANSVAWIHGGQSMDERRAAVDRFNEDCQFLVSTEAGGEGLNLHRRCNVMVNFDLPWNPMRLVQRVGRLYRYGQTERVVVFNLKAANTLDQEILSGMYERLDRVAADMASVSGENRDGLIEDILGQLIGALDVSEVLEEALTTSEERSQERIEDAIRRAQEAAKAQEELLRFATGFDPVVMEGRIQLTTDHVKAFAESMMRTVGIEIANKVHDQDVWDIKLPETWQRRLGRKQNLRIAFDRAKARAYRGEFLDGDHPLLASLLEEAKRDPRGKGAVIQLEDSTLGYTALVRWLDEAGRPADSEYLSLLKDVNGAWRANDEVWIEWLLRPASNGDVGMRPSPADIQDIEKAIDDHLRRRGPKSSVADSHYPISGFIVHKRLDP
jgi:superfamily II DNA or RNA helicase